MKNLPLGANQDLGKPLKLHGNTSCVTVLIITVPLPPILGPVHTAHPNSHLCVIAVYIVEHMGKDVRREAVQGDSREAARGLKALILSEVVIQQGPEVVAAATEESLGKTELRKDQAQGCAQRNWPRA